MLIAGCSHAAGSEIDGTTDSAYNRQHSFGNQVATKMGYRVINMAWPGSNNSAISRGVLEWFAEEYDPTKMEVFVMLSWTESLRMDIPDHRPWVWEAPGQHHDWYPKESCYYCSINFGFHGETDDVRARTPIYHKFMADNEIYLEILSANLVLQMQYFLKMNKVPYVMLNTGSMFTPTDRHLSFYLSLIDSSRYMNMTDNAESFYRKYKDAGYVNPMAKYWHHGEEAHALYAEELYKFIESNKCL